MDIALLNTQALVVFRVLNSACTGEKFTNAYEKLPRILKGT